VEGLRLLLPLLEAPGPGASTQVLTEVYGAVAHLNFNLVRYPESLAAREQALKWARLAQDDGLLVSALAGHYQLALGPNVGAQQAGCNFSRFTYLLGKESADALRDTASRVAALTPNVLLAEIVYLPRSGRASNVAIHPTIYRHELNYAAPPEVGGDKTIPLNELLVGLYNERFYLRWPRRDAQVIPCVGHMLNPMGAPAIVRMLADMRLDGTALLSAFDWGEARSFPFLPRVQLDRFVLSLAQWQFTPYMRDRELPSTSSETFRASLTAWREQWNVPRYVYLTTHDNRLLLDLDSPQQSDELRYELQKLEEDHVVVLQEVFPTLDQIWVQGPGGHYVAEFIIPLISRASINVQDNKARATKVVGLGPSPVPQAFPQKFSPEQRLKGLGSEWLFMKLYCGQALQDDLIAGPLQEFARDALKTGLAEDWFFIRYNDPDPHIRLRFWGDSRLLQSKLLPMLCDWGAWLISKGPCLKYTFDVYDREIERYGGLAGIEVAERLFGADSRAVADLLALLTRRPGIQLERELLAVLSNDDLLAGLGLSASARLALYRQWMRRRHQSGQTYRQKKAQLRLLLGNPSKALADIPGGTEIMAVLVRRREALLSISARLAEVNAQQTSSQPLSSLYASYLHMHCNRLLGTDRALEEEVTDLLLRTWEGLEYAPIS
jgi:thiopeptide-type bacteriocin biosynthesis protein